MRTFVIAVVVFLFGLATIRRWRDKVATVPVATIASLTGIVSRGKMGLSQDPEFTNLNESSYAIAVWRLQCDPDTKCELCEREGHGSRAVNQYQ
jgi:hypothetical protein